MISDADTASDPELFIDTSSLSSESDDDEQNDKVKVITTRQYAQNVIDFSSQYGSDFSISYTALNITGRPSKYPSYGDFSETFAMRTYGKWWDMAPSHLEPIMSQTLPKIVSQDYIVVKFEQYVNPIEIYVYETYNPGAVVRIYAWIDSEKWVCLWEGEPQTVEALARVFMPPIKQNCGQTKVIRLEFNHSNLEYFTEIDAVMLVGNRICPCTHFGMGKTMDDSSMMEKSLIQAFNRSETAKGPIERKLEAINFRPIPRQCDSQCTGTGTGTGFYRIKDAETRIVEPVEILRILDNLKFNELTKDSDQQMDDRELSLPDLPYEVIFNICTKLDLVSLCRLACTCKRLRDAAIDPLLYTELNLLPYWDVFGPNVINPLSERCMYLKKLDLSWCQFLETNDYSCLEKLVNICCKTLTHIRLNSNNILNATILTSISERCSDLKELSIRNCLRSNVITQSSMAAFRNLERLDLFRSAYEMDTLFSVLKNNPHLKHINLSYCHERITMDDVALRISNCNPDIISIDMWKSHGLSSVGIYALSNCSKLEEVDFGWCLREEPAPGDSLKALYKGCPQIKKLFLSSIRCLSNRDLDNMANFCPHLEQLDLTGVMGVSHEMYYGILEKCSNLQLLDLSFNEHLDDQIALWRKKFNVKIVGCHSRNDLS